MKHIFKAVICSLAVVIFFFCVPIGCANGGYMLVYSVSYTTDGVAKTQKSTCGTHYSGQAYITKEEYYASPESKRLNDFTPFNGPSLLSVAKKVNGETYYEIEAKETADDDLERYSVWKRPEVTQYLKRRIVDYYYYFVYVKVIDNTTIKIKNNDGETTYTVSSYSIKKFSV